MFFCALAKKGSLALTVFPWGIFLAELSLKLLTLKGAEISLRIQKVLKHTMLEVTGGEMIISSLSLSCTEMSAPGIF